MKNLNLREIEYILTVAAEGNITKAAQHLYIAQPSLSQALKKIESEMGSPLFYRVKNRMKLTQEGELFVDAGNRIMKIVRDLENGFQDLNQLQEGRLVFGTSFHLGALLVPPAIALYKKRYPHVTLQLNESNSTELESMILNGVIDFAILPCPLQNTNIHLRPFFSSRMVLVMSQDCPLNALAYDKGDRRLYFDLRNADGQPFILGERGHRVRQVSELIFKKTGITPQIALNSKNVETIKRIVSTGMGLTLMPERYLATLYPEIPANYYYLEPEQDVNYAIAIAYLSTGYLSSAAQKFIDILIYLYGSDHEDDGTVRDDSP